MGTVAEAILPWEENRLRAVAQKYEHSAELALLRVNTQLQTKY